MVPFVDFPCRCWHHYRQAATSDWIAFALGRCTTSKVVSTKTYMIASLDANIFGVTGLLWRGIHRSPVNSPQKKRSVTPSFDVFFDLRLNKRLNKQSSGWLFETPSRLLWRHCNVWKRNIWALMFLCQALTPVHNDSDIWKHWWYNKSYYLVWYGLVCRHRVRHMDEWHHWAFFSQIHFLYYHSTQK